MRRFANPLFPGLALAFALATPLALAESPEATAAPDTAASPQPSSAPPELSAVPSPDQEQEYLAWAKSLWDSLNRRHGKIELPGGVATLNVPESFYYLSPADAEKVLTQVWGNPPGGARDTLGMLFPADTTPFDPQSWGVVVAYEEEGYVSDQDAADLDYDALMTQMREAAKEANSERVAAGYEPIELIGWAARPRYDPETHKLYWAREIQFGNQPEHTLNYGIRILGRKGVLVLNFVAAMDQKDLIDAELDTVLAMAQFEQGSRYQDFVPGMDQVAAYGIGGLIAGKVIAKTGFFVVALVFLKKFGVLILAALGALVAKLWRGRKKPA